MSLRHRGRSRPESYPGGDSEHFRIAEASFQRIAEASFQHDTAALCRAGSIPGSTWLPDTGYGELAAGYVDRILKGEKGPMRSFR
jgi:hypothetical protein